MLANGGGRGREDTCAESPAGEQSRRQVLGEGRARCLQDRVGRDPGKTGEGGEEASGAADRVGKGDKSCSLDINSIVA